MRSTPEASAAPDAAGELLAAVDLGSNSFHLVIARCDDGARDARLHHRDSVRLAAGVDAAGRLDPARRAFALEVLSRYRSDIAEAGVRRVRAVATEAVRRLAEREAFLAAAGAALGWPVECISGDEEARLIWRGATLVLPAVPARRLVLDIGGASTEFILGADGVAETLHSAAMGCVASAREAFPDARLDERAWRAALDRLVATLRPVARRFAARGWDEVWTGSGTARTIERMAAAAGFTKARIEPDVVAELAARVVACGHVERVTMPGLDADHAPVAAGGLLVMQAVFEAFGLDAIGVRGFSMRDGVLDGMLRANVLD